MHGIERSRIGILDLGEAGPGLPPRQRIDIALQCAVKADELGFRSYWLAEHHSLASNWANPAVVIALLASRTTRIAVGAAGVL
ncbi:MAG: LLM class flavin-dependent oxidoreductase, partial [Candidatus Eremiobacteraeota bacterium]|nr:LLM class flavin-dependent oxidoreductase [Candidatus Eremiobacteraeota bacterium]